MSRRGLLALSCGLALGCARPRAEPAVPQSAAPWALVYVAGSEATLERRDDATLDWSPACAGTCGQYLPPSGAYRLRGASVTSAPFSLPAPDLGRVVLRFDDEGHVFTSHTLPIPGQPFAPIVLFLQMR